MTVGILYFDDRPIALADKLAAFAERHRVKTGRYPDTAFIHPRTGDEGVVLAGGLNTITVKHSQYMLVHHAWLGVADDKQPVAA